MTAKESSTEMTNGAGAAAILAAGIGAFVLALAALLGDKIPAVRAAMIWWKPTGPLSGVTTLAVVGWLVAWAVLDVIWRKESVGLGRVNLAAFALLVLSLLLTFPPVVDLF